MVNRKSGDPKRQYCSSEQNNIELSWMKASTECASAD